MTSDIDMKWWGWGDPDKQTELPGPALERLARMLGMDLSIKPVCKFDQLQLPKSALSGKTLERLNKILGADQVRLDDQARVLHAAGKSYPDLVRMRSGKIDPAPDVVVYPTRAEQVAELLRLCAKDQVAVVPFGGGTSVVGGVEPLRGKFRAVAALDLRYLNELINVDDLSLTATVASGLRGPQLESVLAAKGLTLGHYPQSFQYSTVGGWVATRSAGQASSGYGRIDELVVAVKSVCPVGEIETKALPATAAGPSIKDLLVGSEGIFGVLTQTTLKVKPSPAARRYETWLFKDFKAGTESLRLLTQAEVCPDIARLSDQAETSISMLLAASNSLKFKLGERYIGARGYSDGCLVVLGFEGSEASVSTRRRAVAAAARGHGGLFVGTSAGESWHRGRFEGPYLRDALLDRAVMVETLETATEWSKLHGLYNAVRQALTTSLDADGLKSIVMCHVSHLYPDGASLYFTFVSPQLAGDEIGQWRRAKTAATDAIVANGGTITHHHAVGIDHAGWLRAEIGGLGVKLLRTAKEALDPEGIMNPGKLIESA